MRGRLRGVVSVLLVACVAFAGFQCYEAFSCSWRERSVAKEIPQLTTPQQEFGIADTGECTLGYHTDSTAEEALNHYRQQFREKDWRIQRDEPIADSSAYR